MRKEEAAVYEAGFAIDEVLLYLDTHPRDREALAFYQCMKKQYKEAVKEYVDQIGPLTVDHVPEGCEWAWVQTPWPWEDDLLHRHRASSYFGQFLF